MKYSVFFLALFSIMTAGCNSNKYIINGMVTDTRYEGTYVYLQEPNDLVMGKYVDSALITNGKFVFKGETEKPLLYTAKLDMKKVEPRSELARMVLIEPGATIMATFDSVITVSGTVVNDSYNDFKSKERESLIRLMELGDKLNEAEADVNTSEAQKDQLINAYKKEQTQLVGHNYEFIQYNATNKLGETELYGKIGSFSDEQKKILLDKVDTAFKAQKKIEEVIKRLNEPEKAAVGTKFIDLQLTDTEGNSKALSDYIGKGKLVLVDFWASWCIPCLNSMPDLLETYNQYKAKGFEVVAISQDHVEANWKKAIKDHNMPWNHLANLQKKAIGSEEYGITGIPFTVLIDNEGTIIGKKMEKKELREKLSQLLN